MGKYRCWSWLSLVAVSITTLLFIAGCGGGGGGATTPPPTAKPSISGTVNFPSLNSLVAKQVSAPAVKASAAPTVELRTLSGTVIATVQATGTGTAADPFTYTFANLDTADYVIKAVSSDGKVVKALIDKASVGTALTRDVDTISTTTIIVAEKKLNVATGTIGEAASTAVTTTAIANNVNPVALESSIKTAVNTVQYSASSASQAAVDIVNLVNVVAATVNNKADVAQVLSGAVALPSTVTVTQFTLSGGTALASDQTAATVQASAPQTLTTTVTSYTPPAANTVYYISKVYDYNTVSTGTPVAGVTVTTIGLPTEITTVTDVNGLFVLAGIPQSTSFTVKMSKPSVGADAYSNTFAMTTNIDSSDRPYALWSSAKLAGWGHVAGTGVIRTKVVVSTDLVSGSMGGVVIKATDKADGTSYTVKYFDNTGAVSSTLTSTNAANGNYIVLNIPDGRTVDITASKSGYTFNTRTFTVHADAVCMARTIGTAAAGTTSALKSSLMSGWYEIRSRQNIGVQYYYVERIGIASDGATLTNTPVSYFDRSSKTWVSSIPAGFPADNSTDYTLSSSGTWVSDNNGPNGYSAVFNSDVTARLTNPATGEVFDISFTSTNISGQAISSLYTDGAPMLAAAGVNPAGSAMYSITISNLADTYQVWGSYPLTTLASVPAEFAESSVSGNTIDIENSNRAEYFYGKFVDGSTTSVNIYRNTNGSQTAGQLVGTGTASNVTVLGQPMIEVTIPAGLKSTYGLANVIFAVVNGTVRTGVHYVAGINSSNGGAMLNDVAINHIKANIDTALAKPVVGKQISKALLGW